MQALIDFCPVQPGQAGALRCAFDQPLQTLVAHTLAEVRPVLDSVDRLARQGRWCVGYVRYEAAPAFDAALTVHAAQGPLAWFGVYEKALDWPAEETHETAVATWHDSLTREAFNRNMDTIHQAIGAGDLYQINYTAPLLGQLQGSPQALFQALQRAQPGGYAAFIDNGIEQVLSVSPELFFDWHGQQILARPMKGTAPRGANAEQDAQQMAQLRASPKEQAENVMIVDLLRNDLSRIAEPFSVQVPELFRIEALPTVFQMSSDVTATTRTGTTLTDVFTALFPCGSVTGAPKVQAMRLIHALETQPRGIYCGAIGVVRPGGHATFNVAIRTVTVKDGAARCGFGSGITYDATAEGEWQEWRNKQAFLARASQPFELLETLRLEDGVLRDAARHLARMARAARHFGYPFPITVLDQALAQQAQTHPQGVWRVRLLLNAGGKVTAQAFAMETTPSRVRLRLAPSAFDAAHGEFVRFKTTQRAHYDAVAPVDPGVFDTLLWNAQGELTECTRCNIAVRLEGRWRTPPLACGLLDGVARTRYLEEGRIEEGVVRVEDLPRAQGLAVFNSLRGWIEAELV
ncbi:MAG: aminodeoxychorismate synthase component I [Pseudomonadota bacterium]|nr:aminodeoxychorismate synthase component I [Pseudomonadota bacterium]